MQGGEGEEAGGLMGRVAHNLFRGILQRKQTRTYTIAVSFLQIYSEKIYDLLNPSSLNNRSLSVQAGIEGLRLRWSKEEQFTVENLFLFECRDESELLKYINVGLKNRISAAHKLNLQSSRSHSILTIRI